MKIQSSSVLMASAHQETSFAYKESVSIDVAKSQDAASAILSLSSQMKGQSLKEAMASYTKQQKDEALKKQQKNEANALKHLADQIKADKVKNLYEPQQDDDLKIKLLKQILAALQGKKIEDEPKSLPKEKHSNVADLRSSSFSQSENFSFNLSQNEAISVTALEIGTTGSGTTWQKITATSGFMVETESTSFASTGLVKTADGRSIDFNVELSMTRAFMSKFDVLEAKDYIKTDPLIINLDSSIASVTDQKFLFDLDSDGQEESISFAGKGSGFLALDKNNDGKINNGSELFGTKSGDGFKDLSLYDDDKNGWIDENDDIFNLLKIWTKDENGDDLLIDLKTADVGAIYLGNADTQFSLKDNNNNLNAEIKKTGIYLKERTGAIGTLNHVDLAL